MPRDLDLDIISSDFYNLFIMSGKGKGGKGGQFPGNCHTCGKYGHRAAECRSGQGGEKGKGKGKGKGVVKKAKRTEGTVVEVEMECS